MLLSCFRCMLRRGNPVGLTYVRLGFVIYVLSFHNIENIRSVVTIVMKSNVAKMCKRL